MKLKIDTFDYKEDRWDLAEIIWVIWILLTFAMFVFNFLAFTRWEYPPELLRFTIWVLVINAFIFIRIE